MTPTSTDKTGGGNPRALFLRTGVGAILASLILTIVPLARSGQDMASTSEGPLLRFLGIAALPESVDYVVNKAQFQLHTLLTEQRHAKTWALSERVRTDTGAGLRMLFAVDEDIAVKLGSLAESPQSLDQLVSEVEKAVVERRKIYIYGCGATGRLAKQMESSFWRPFWRRVKADPEIWAKLKPRLDPAVEDELFGEMTGGDRALISSLEGFEDLPLIGRLQLRDRGIRKGDVVVCVTEGGETSSVIGTVLGALDEWKASPIYNPQVSRRKLYFIYNNPDDKLRPFERSRTVIEEPGITKINLTTGPQSITGSTRMQATTIETFVIGSALETAVERVLRPLLTRREMERLGFKDETTIAARLRKFGGLLEEVKRQVPALAKLTNLEAAAYAGNRFSTYFAQAGLITVFIDSTERSPTFRLYPLDTVREPRRKCWIQVWTNAPEAKSAWQAFLGRPFRGLRTELYQKPFEEEVEDPYLRDKALASLTKAGDDQAALYDFSFGGTNVARRAPKRGDLGIMVLLGPEAGDRANEKGAFQRFAGLTVNAGADIGVIAILDKPDQGPAPNAGVSGIVGGWKDGSPPPQLVEVTLAVSSDNDPFRVRAQVALKMLLNAHSTAVMAKLGKVVGNTMTNVSPSNLKLIGRATYLIMLHVNDALGSPDWVRNFGVRKPISYGEANAVLFDALAFMKERTQDSGQAAEVPLSIIRILESLKRKQALTAEEALAIYKKTGLADYLAGAAKPPQPNPAY